jgi:hypothetical protein
MSRLGNGGRGSRFADKNEDIKLPKRKKPGPEKKFKDGLVKLAVAIPPDMKQRVDEFILARAVAGQRITQADLFRESLDEKLKREGF